MRAGEMRKRDGEEERVKQDDRSEDLYLSDSSYMRTTDPKIATTHAGNLFGGNLRASFRVRPMDSGGEIHLGSLDIPAAMDLRDGVRIVATYRDVSRCHGTKTEN
ncbi:uncharacterized protein LOC105258323 isoform X1 [Camponotus floridanus]|uniref:uncharacterized protein LOC105258323 isoform X1 n=1 Tax=Camponotus floridanus TaxID=104421 RepID=UPI00059C00C3|nr:uncharacterized protein LOC105258323 isoform X1 [Camponotus floridanus]